VSEPSIEFQDVSLRFKILSERGIVTFKEWAIRWLTSKISYRELVALSDVSFSLQPARSLGIIGHNGAGKSTLLRVAAGILEPTRGKAIMRGRMAPVIELGLGFEAELSGRENIFFNGALLGRSQEEMESRLDEIVDFAELDEFIDQPIRTYSTGMVARLAFAVATTVDAQILLLDEVLSVGDESFRMKCNERLESFQRRGVTILLVSHDLDAVQSICDEALWLEHGKVRGHGPSSEIVAAYRASVSGDSTVGGAIEVAPPRPA
jgi:ABC-type polysaccharide/polyol phosphate transport system ATPase subunit